ncbi:HAMP domain-containing protein [Kallotenue papyrolyticum]|uniref:HAMP domain-containing protein n=1 Tax=Kallotenue papyrolyticum TaxID=1325125 RepID=UPI0009DCDC7E|nr:HAMP domain-containing protein [Kallotenue papyrolyticum]
MKYISIRYYRRFMKPRLTLQLRLALWSSGLLLIFSLGLILFINITATLVAPRDVASSAHLDPPPTSGALEPSLPSLSSLSDTVLPISPRINVHWDVLRQIRLISLIGLGMVAVLGGAGAYWLAGRALHPVRQISRTAQRIEAGTLNIRFGLIGPNDELKELADTFDAMMDRLENAFLQQRRFVADAAHELRTPLQMHARI